MKKLLFSLTVCAVVSVFGPDLHAQGSPTASPPLKSAEDTEAAYTRSIEKRTADILAMLEFTNSAAKGKVRDIIMAQYRALRAWHDANDPKLKAAKGDTNAVAQIRSSLKALHDQFIAALSAQLTPEQVEKVKDKMTYGKVQFTYAGYLASYPDLPEPHKQKILELLREAREEAMDEGSSDEKTAVFQRYKGKINNYLAKQGIHPTREKAAKPAAGQGPDQPERMRKTGGE